MYLASAHDGRMRSKGTRWARNIDRLIRARGLTQGAVATAAGLDKNALSRLLQQPTAKTSTLEAIATAIGVDISEIYAPEVTATEAQRAAVRRLVREELAGLFGQARTDPDFHSPRKAG